MTNAITTAAMTILRTVSVIGSGTRPTFSTRLRLRSWLKANPAMHSRPTTMVSPSKGPQNPRMLGT